MRYQDLKIREAGRLATLGAGLLVLVGVFVAERPFLSSALGRRYIAFLAGRAIVSPIAFAMALYYLLSSPALNARFIRWAERRRSKALEGFDVSLLDANDPDYNVPTIQYLLAKHR